jgi:hypothetical protein
MLGQVPVLGALAQREVAQQTRMMGPGIRAVTLERIAPMLQRLGPTAARWGAELQSAMQRGGPAAMAAAHYVMQQTDPRYRQTYEQLQQEPQ